jgi:hypothetical protein
MRKQRGSLSGFQQCQQVLYSMHGSGKFCSYTRFRRSFFSFLRFVRAPGGRAFFFCPICKNCPDVVFCDGAFIAFGHVG